MYQWYQNPFKSIDDPITLTKKQNEILTMVCELYEVTVGDYIKEALIESLKEEITEGDFCSLLASRLDDNMAKSLLDYNRNIMIVYLIDAS